MVAAALAAIIMFTYVALLIFVYNPFYSQTEDGKLLKHVKDGGLVEYLNESGALDGEKFGFFAATLTTRLISFPSYFFGSTTDGSRAFITNAFIIVLAVAAITYVLSFLLRFNSRLFLIAFFGAFLWNPLLDAFFFPGLDEKGILLVGACMFGWQLLGFQIHKTSVLLVGSLVVFFLAISTKNQLLIYVPSLMFLAYARRKQLSNPLGLYVLLALWTSIGVFWISSTLGSEYVESARGSRDIGLLLNPYLLVLVTLFLAIITVRFLTEISHLHNIIVDSKVLKSNLLFALILVGSAIVAIGYMGVSRSYHLGVFATSFSISLAILVSSFRAQVIQNALLVLIAVSSVAFVGLRLPAVFAPLGSIKLTLASPTFSDLAKSHATFALNGCPEGPSHFTLYADFLSSVDANFVVYGETSHASSHVLVADKKLCPLINDSRLGPPMLKDSGILDFNLYQLLP